MPLHNIVLHPFAPKPGGPERPPFDPDEPPVLLADHRGAGLASHQGELEEAGFATRIGLSLADSLELVGRIRLRAVVLDPAGIGAVEIQRFVERVPRAPLLLVVDPEDPGAGLQALEAARHPLGDAVHRGAPAEEFCLRLRALERAAEWRHRASHDERTELLRPAAFEERLQAQASAARRHGFPLALALLDLDDFGQVNKTHDHVVGDRVLGTVGRIVREGLRAEDLAGRLGGDEFGLILPYAEEAEARACVQRVLTTLAGERFTGRGGHRLRVTASAGFAVLETGETTGLEGVRARAEEALRAAKVAGGDRGVGWSECAGDGARVAGS